MHRLTLASAVTALFAAVLVVLPVAVGAQEGGSGRTLTFTKVVDGPGPVGGYAVEWTCVTEGGGDGGTVTFDTAGPDAPQTIQVSIPNDDTTCTFEETVTNGAESVTYDCVPTTPDMTCPDSQTAVLDHQGGKISNTDVTITNTFPASVAPAPPEEPEPPATSPDVVTATPPFTG